MRRASRGAPPARVLATLLILLVAACQPSAGIPTPSTSPAPVVTDAAATSRAVPAPETASPAAASPRPLSAFAMNLFRDGDFVPQYTFEWCVAASIQMMFNMAAEPNRTDRADQGDLWSRARARSSDPWGGANGRGWVAILDELGVGPYEFTSFPELDEALLAAARAIRETERPVGLIMWRGRHAWVMSGFESRGDPAVDGDAVVTGVHVLDPLYPHGDRTWGPSPEPNALLTPAELGEQFVSRDRRAWSPTSLSGYVLILPVP